tara:strand:+ start:292 stop:522 length:231 start_codon:yes stop_codon:yes gene_type:complete
MIIIIINASKMTKDVNDVPTISGLYVLVFCRDRAASTPLNSYRVGSSLAHNWSIGIDACCAQTKLQRTDFTCVFTS